MAARQVNFRTRSVDRLRGISGKRKILRGS